MQEGFLGKIVLFQYDARAGGDVPVKINNMRRFSRETKSQLISDAQRIPKDWSADPLQWMHFQLVARRFKKNKLFNPDGSFTDHYGKTTLVNGLIPELISDTEFDEMFAITKCEIDDLPYYKPSWIKNLFTELFTEYKDAFVCLDEENPIAKHLKSIFNVPIYLSERIFINREHFRYCKGKDDVYDRNSVFYQVTCFGDDLPVISNDENNKNRPIFIWFFKDKIVYKLADGYNEW